VPAVDVPSGAGGCEQREEEEEEEETAHRQAADKPQPADCGAWLFTLAPVHSAPGCGKPMVRGLEDWWPVLKAAMAWQDGQPKTGLSGSLNTVTVLGVRAALAERAIIGDAAPAALRCSRRCGVTGGRIVFDDSNATTGSTASATSGVFATSHRDNSIASPFAATLHTRTSAHDELPPLTSGSHCHAFLLLRLRFHVLRAHATRRLASPCLSPRIFFARGERRLRVRT